ncbi:MAG: hypothetical protein HY897_06750 [Deltaproteobacteria bacterium]|nr:hypothetical protein [Deltaproteobacteria bacterium]
MAKKHSPENLRIWIEARRRFCLSHAQVRMARELGLNLKKFGKLGATLLVVRDEVRRPLCRRGLLRLHAVALLPRCLQELEVVGTTGRSGR